MIQPDWGGRRSRLFVLPGGDSPWRRNRSGHAGILGVRSSPARATAQSISPSGRSAVRVLRGTGCTTRRNGGMIFGPHSSCGSRSAASALNRDSGSELRGWTTRFRTVETGRYSQTAEISRAYVSGITTKKRLWRWPKDSADSAKSKRLDPAKLDQAWAHAHVSGSCPRVVSTTPKASDTLPQPQKVLPGLVFNHMAPYVEDFFPTGGFEGQGVVERAEMGNAGGRKRGGRERRERGKCREEAGRAPRRDLPADGEPEYEKTNRPGGVVTCRDPDSPQTF